MQPSTSHPPAARMHGPVLAVAVAVVLLAACGKEPAAPPAPAAGTAPAATPAGTTTPAATTTAAGPDATSPVAWRPDAIDELLAPIALYPDALLGQILAASVNPQEVLDGGNWLLQNPSLKGKALDQAAEKAGFGPAMRALFAFPEVVDMMCQNLDWTTQLGEAFDADQKAVLDSVQRLRTRAVNAGTFKSTPQQKVATQTVEAEGGAKKEVVVVEPANPQVVYVPKYDPEAVYQPAPTTVVNNNVGTPATTTTTTTSGPTTGDVVAAGVIGFGAGILISEIFDDDDWDDYYRPSWGYGGVYYGGRPWYGNTYVYAPTYVGYHPAGGYYRPATYPHRWDRPNVNVGNDVNININNGNYFNRFPNNPNRPNRPGYDGGTRPALARDDRPQLDRSKVQGTYAGATGNGDRPKIPTSAPRVPGQLDGKLPQRPDGMQAGTRDRPAVTRPQGEYAGAKDRVAQNRPKMDRPGSGVDRPTRDVPAGTRPSIDRPSPGSVGGANDRKGRDPLNSTRDLQRPTPDRGFGRPTGGLDRGSAPQSRPMPQQRPTQMDRGPQMRPGGAFAGASNRGGASMDRTASSRGRASMGSAGRPAPRGR